MICVLRWFDVIGDCRMVTSVLWVIPTDGQWSIQVVDLRAEGTPSFDGDALEPLSQTS